MSSAKVEEYSKCPMCGQMLKGWKEKRKLPTREKEVIVTVYDHKNPKYKHVTPFGTFKCYNKKRRVPK